MTLALLSRNLFLGLALAAVACGKTYDCDSPKVGDKKDCPSGAAAAGGGGTSQAGGSGSGGSAAVGGVAGGGTEAVGSGGASQVGGNGGGGMGGGTEVVCDSCLLQDEELYTGFSVFPARRPDENAYYLESTAGQIFTRDATHYYVLGHGVSAVEMSTGLVSIPILNGSDAVVAHDSGAVVLQAGEGFEVDRNGHSNFSLLSAGVEISNLEGDTKMSGLASDGVDILAVGGVENEISTQYGIVRSDGSSPILDMHESIFEAASLYVSHQNYSRLLATDDAIWATAGSTPTLIKTAGITPTLVKVVDGAISATTQYSGGPTLGFQKCAGDIYIAANDITRFSQSDAASEVVVAGSSSPDGPVISAFACNDWGIFWTLNACGDFSGELFGMEYGSSTPESLMTGMTHPAAILAEDDLLYWLSSGLGGTGISDAWIGSIHRVDLAPLYDLP